MAFEAVPAAVEQVATEVIGAAIEVHKHLGPGFLERIYHEALCQEFEIRRINFERDRRGARRRGALLFYEQRAFASVCY